MAERLGKNSTGRSLVPASTSAAPPAAGCSQRACPLARQTAQEPLAAAVRGAGAAVVPRRGGQARPPRGAAAAGQQQWRALARQAALRGKRVAVLECTAYGGHKDVNEAWVAGERTVGDGPALAGEDATRLQVPEDLQETWAERVAIMVADGGLPHAEAACLAWAGLQTPGKEQ